MGVDEEGNVFVFHKFQFKIPRGYPRGDAKGAGRYLSMDLRGEIWARDTKLGLVVI